MAKPIWTGDPGLSADQSFCCWPNCWTDIRSGQTRLPICWEHGQRVYREVAATYGSFQEMIHDGITERWAEQAASRALDPEPQGYVYFIQFQKQVKIGFSINPKVRLNALPHDRVIAVVEGTRQDEKRLHAAFKHIRTVGEWFLAESDLLEFAESLESVDYKNLRH